MSGYARQSTRVPWVCEDEFTGKRPRAHEPWEYEDEFTGQVFVDTAHRDHVLALERMREDESALQERGRQWLDGAHGELSDRVRLGLSTGTLQGEGGGGSEPR